MWKQKNNKKKTGSFMEKKNMMLWITLHCPSVFGVTRYQVLCSLVDEKDAGYATPDWMNYNIKPQISKCNLFIFSCLVI